MASFRMAVAATLGFLIAAPVSAQTGAGGLASVTVSAMTIEQDASASIAASIGYRLNPIVALGIELTFVPGFRPYVPDFPTILDGGFRLSGGLSDAIFPTPSITVKADGGARRFSRETCGSQFRRGRLVSRLTSSAAPAWGT